MKHLLFVCLTLAMSCPAWTADTAAPAATAVPSGPAPEIAAQGVAGWIGSGGNDSVLIGPGNLVPVGAPNYEGDRGSRSAYILFDNSTLDSKDSLELKYTHTRSPNAKGEPSWMTCILATPNWQFLNASNKKTLQFYVKGLPRESSFSLSLNDAADKKTAGLDITPFIDDGEAAEWRRVAIPIKDIPGVQNIDLTQVKTLGFSPVSEGSYDLFIDNVIFDRAEIQKPPVKRPAVKPRTKAKPKSKAKRSGTPVTP